jgi:hypothetical protein
MRIRQSVAAQNNPKREFQFIDRSYEQKQEIETHENLCRWGAEANHGPIQDAPNVKHGTVRGEANQQESQAVRDGNQHQCPSPTQNSQTRSSHQTADQRRQRWDAAC